MWPIAAPGTVDAMIVAADLAAISLWETCIRAMSCLCCNPDGLHVRHECRILRNEDDLLLQLGQVSRWSPGWLASACALSMDFIID